MAKNFRLGGGGGVAFLMNSSNSTHFGMGYGGVMAEYSFTAWLSIGLMIGGGAYAISTVNSGSDASSTVSTVSADGFLLVKPDLLVEVPINSWFRLGAAVSLFLPNVSKLQSLNFGLHFIVGRY